MPTPVGPVPPDPNDPDFWDWGDDEDEDLRPRHQALRLLVVCVIVFGLVLLLLVSVL
ncbi:MAG: hypothetical protein WB565_09130 [Acidimicrobiales bacterium]